MKHKISNLRKLTVIGFLSIAVILSSCKKYLSPEPLSTFEPSIAFSNVPNAKASLMGAYLSLAGDFGYGIRASYYYPYDDDAIMGGGSGTDQSRHQKAMDPAGELVMQVAMANGTNSDSKLGLQNGTRMNGVGGALGNVLPTYFYQFDSTDVRRDVTVVPFEVVQDIYGRGHASNSIYDGKFSRDWVTNPGFYFSSGATTGTNPVTLTPASNASLQNMQLNWPLIRFADVLLMYAEADNEINNGPSATAIAAFKEVSQRGHNGIAALVPAVPTDKVGFFKLLVRERSLEFGGEGIRKYDLIRWNLLGTAIAETKANLAILALKTPTDMNQPTYMAPQPSYTLGKSLPDSMFSLLTAPPETAGVFYNSYYRPAPVLKDIAQQLGVPNLTAVKVNWRGNASITTTYVNYYGIGFQTGKSELFPIPQASIDANGNLRPQNPGY